MTSKRQWRTLGAWHPLLPHGGISGPGATPPKGSAAIRRRQDDLAAIAGELKCSRQSVSRWYAAWKRDRTGGLRGAGRAGRKPQLNTPQLQVVERALRQGARAHGFGTELWTLPRVAAVSERLTGVKYHPGHVWKILGSE